MTSVADSLSPTTANSNTFSVLSTVTPTPIIRVPTFTTTPLGKTPLSNARMTGLVSSTTPIVFSNTPVSIPQTVNVPVIPKSSPTIQIPRASPILTTTVVPPASPTARSALLNLTTNQTVTSTTMIPTENLLSQAIKVTTPSSSLPLKPTVEIMNQEFEVRNYQGIISKASLENELLNAGYAPLSRIVIRTDNGDKRTQFIKAINKKGQKVFILIDVNGYTTARSTDLTLIEAHNASIVPYSLKTGAYNCAGKDVCGVAFECGPDAVCVLSRDTQDLAPKEANFVFVEQHAPAAAVIESEGTIMTYPVVRLSEIRANPALVLSNTDTVTRRLRNTAYVSLLEELATTQQSINKLNEAFVCFNRMREDAATKLNRTLTQLEESNDIYITCPPTNDEDKDKYRRLQFNLTKRNEGIAALLRSMKRVADARIDIDSITGKITDITEYCEKEFAHVEHANTE